MAARQGVAVVPRGRPRYHQKMEDRPSILDCPVSGDSLRAPSDLKGFVSAGQEWPGWQFDCPHCGTFKIVEIEYHHLIGYLHPQSGTIPLKIQRHRAVLAYALWRMAGSGVIPVLTNGMTLRVLQEDRLPNIGEQRDNLLEWFGSEVEIGPSYGITYVLLGARVGSGSPGAFRLLLESMLEQGFLHGKIGADAGGQFRLAHRGLGRLEELERAAPSGRNAFMAMKFGDETLDRIVDGHFKGAVKDTGFSLYRLDERPEAGLIDARLRNEIRNCRFLIADLSHANAGSYWEAGYAEGLGKPVIYTCEKSVFEGKAADIAKPHFDTNHHLTIIWDATEPQTAASRLRETIRFTIPEARQTI
jgi:hypothetical protein